LFCKKIQSQTVDREKLDMLSYKKVARKMLLRLTPDVVVVVVVVDVVEAVVATASRIRSRCDSSRAVIEFLPIG